MTNRIMALFALIMLLGFLGILVWHVPRWDLGIVIAITMALAGYDFLLGARRKKS
ncbi:hypothetical protein [Thalassospira sp.]|uniref:hypothetical protein n=1 Tax=Thalassospira sp. TaxID=1912094 RepID=UPI0027354ED2|nr:hypothetical protein [Thalassospira sp.]MDP2696535.1 hypothetical protein [Thalassospira sp.]